MLAAIGVGAREAIALGVIAEMKGKAQSPDIKAALHHCSRDPMAVVAVLKAKGLVRPEDNRVLIFPNIIVRVNEKIEIRFRREVK